jgi:hypothetical protein
MDEEPKLTVIDGGRAGLVDVEIGPEPVDGWIPRIFDVNPDNMCVEARAMLLDDGTWEVTVIMPNTNKELGSTYNTPACCEKHAVLFGIMQYVEEWVIACDGEVYDPKD